MTAHAPDIHRLQHVRLFSPAATIAAIGRGLDSLELDVQLKVMLAAGPSGLCLLCEQPAPTPSVMGWADVPGGRAAFSVCEDCGDRPELEEAIFAKLGFQPLEHCGNA